MNPVRFLGPAVVSFHTGRLGVNLAVPPIGALAATLSWRLARPRAAVG